jgi:hypothetical protein
MMIVNGKYKLEYHSRVVNYSPRVVNYALREQLQYRRHS